MVEVRSLRFEGRGRSADLIGHTVRLSRGWLAARRDSERSVQPLEVLPADALRSRSGRWWGQELAWRPVFDDQT